MTLRCTASRLCKRPAFEVEGLPRPVCIRHATMKAGGRYGVSRQKGGRSKAEADYAVMLGLAEKAGNAKEVEREVWYELRLKDNYAVPSWKGNPSTEGVLVERYYLDFRFLWREPGQRKWARRHVDKKAGLYTDSFRRKQRWVQEVFGIVIETPDETKGRSRVAKA